MTEGLSAGDNVADERFVKLYRLSGRAALAIRMQLNHAG